MRHRHPGRHVGANLVFALPPNRALQVKSPAMPRLIFNTFAILSLLLCIFLIYCCLHSFFPSQMHFESIDGSLMILSWSGEISHSPEDEIYNPASDKFFGIRNLVKNMSPISQKDWLGFRSISGG